MKRCGGMSNSISEIVTAITAGGREVSTIVVELIRAVGPERSGAARARGGTRYGSSSLIIILRSYSHLYRILRSSYKTLHTL